MYKRQVLYDTKADAAAMENHAQREEVRQARTNGTGESSRYSATLLEQTLSYARRLPDGTVLRLSASRVTMGVLLDVYKRQLSSRAYIC